MASHDKDDNMIHDLTAGHFDQRGDVTRSIDMLVVRKLLADLGGTDAQGVPTLDGWKVRFADGCVILPWIGGRTNRVTEEFAIRLHRETGCTLADREHGRVIEVQQLEGLKDKAAVAG
jgi:hypothetical protein